MTERCHYSHNHSSRNKLSSMLRRQSLAGLGRYSCITKSKHVTAACMFHNCGRTCVATPRAQRADGIPFQQRKASAAGAPPSKQRASRRAFGGTPAAHETHAYCKQGENLAAPIYIPSPAPSSIYIRSDRRSSFTPASLSSTFSVSNCGAPRYVCCSGVRGGQDMHGGLGI